MTRPIHLRVNGSDYIVETAAGAYLLDVLREELGLQGTKEACAEGECSVNGQAVCSADLMFATVDSSALD